MKVLVTGATGFVGGHLIETLLTRGDQVTALVRTPGKAVGLEARGVRLVPGDLDHADALALACRDQEVVYHLAGLVAARSEAEFLSVNRDGTARLVAAAERAARPRMVLVSSLAAAGPTEPGRPLRGDEPPRPITRYGRSKLAAESVVRSSSLPWTILRPPAVYGPRDREMFRVFRAASLGVGPVFGRGDQYLSLIFGPDLASAIVAAGTTSKTVGHAYCPCHPEILTARALTVQAGQAAGKRVRILPVPRWLGRAALWLTDGTARLAGRATVLSFDKAAEFFAPAWLGDPAPLTRATGWTASHDFATGARATIAWYRQAGWL